jgi:hypothetical protein
MKRTSRENAGALPQAHAWQRGARGERQTARLLDRLGRDGYQVFHDLALPGPPPTSITWASAPAGCS